MKNYKVCWEIDIMANDPIDAAKQVQQMMDDADSKWMFYVQRDGSKKVYSVDLDAHRSIMKNVGTNYQPRVL